jgi:uncharacterized membrane protein
MQEKNPYATPAAPVDDVTHHAALGELIEGGRAVPSGNAWQWIVDGFNLFKQSPGVWILILIVLFAIMALLSVIPLLGTFALNLLYPVFAAGMLLGCHAQAQGEPLEVAHLFAGFRERTGQLVLVGVLYMVGVFVAVLVSSLIFGVSMLASGLTGAAVLVSLTGLLFVLVVMALLVPLVMAIWFAPALVVFHDVAPIEAMKQSFRACLKNVVPFLIYGIIVLGLGIVATIPFGLGWLVLGPTLIGSTYYSYRDIFLSQP